MTAPSTRTVHTFCRYCLASCGVEVTVEDNRVTKISADKQNPHTWQDFCAKGRTANQLVEHPRRILNPMRRDGDTYIEATWDEVRTAAQKLTALGNGVVGYGEYSKNNTGGWHFTAEMFSRGGEVAVKEGDTWKASFNNATGKALLQDLYNMRWVDNSMGQKQLLEWVDLVQMMASGKLGMNVGAPDRYARYRCTASSHRDGRARNAAGGRNTPMPRAWSTMSRCPTSPMS